jgi:YidC/Oxa1 family membrane protein insertase
MDFLLNPFITVLALLYSIFGNNIVLAITALTVIIRLATSPLLLQQQKSTEAMQTLQPQIKRLQEKYKGDREKLSMAQMELYKEYKINPLGGCLPLLVQLPILFALYGAITYGLGATPYQVVDLSGRLLIPGLDTLVPLDKLWLGMDLTQPPSFSGETVVAAIALPLLVYITTWLQSKLTIPPTDPNDKNNPAASMTRSMTTIMPIMFAFFALTFSVGLSIYFIVSNIVGIIQYTLLGKAHWNQVLPGRVGPTGRRSKPVASAEQQALNDAIYSRVVQKVDSAPRNAALARAGSGNGKASDKVLATKPKPAAPSSSLVRTNGRKKKK